MATKKFPSECIERVSPTFLDKLLIWNSETGESDNFVVIQKLYDIFTTLRDIVSVIKTSTEGLVDTYTITYHDGAKSTFQVTNGEKGDTGNGIESIAKTSTSGLVDTYTITFTEGNQTTFTVTNGKGISSISKTSTSGITDTYTITYTDGATSSYSVVNGKGITNIEKTSTSGLVDTYTITYNDGSPSSFTVSNGNGITTIAKTGTEGLVDTYTITLNDGSTTTFTVTNGAKGDTGNGISSILKTGTSGLVDTYTITFSNGATTTFTVTNGATPEIKQTTGTSEINVMSQKAVTDEITQLTANMLTNWVGVVIDPTLSSSEPAPKSTVAAYRATELMRTGNLHHHKFGNSRIFNAFQMAIVNRSTRKVAWYLDKNNPTLRADKTLSSPDWATQNIAVIVPNLWRRVTVLDVVTGKYEVAYDIEPFAGAQLWHEESAHSPGFASMDRTLTQLVSVVSNDVRFRGGNNQDTWDALPSTQLGRPATSINRINFENYAAAAGWETGNIADRTLWHELTALYFANTNIQLGYTNTLTSEGYPQGGLGAGVTIWNSSRWNNRSAYFPIHAVGEGFMSIGCNVGVKSMTEDKYYVGEITAISSGNLVAAGSFASSAGWSASYVGYTVQNLNTLAEATITAKTDDNTLALSADIFTTAGEWYWIKGVSLSYEIPVFFGLEHLYGEVWDWVSGVNVDVSATTENGGTGESNAYVCTDFSKRASTITADYKLIGLIQRDSDYIKELYRDFAIAKINSGASSTTFMADQAYYADVPSSGNVIRGLLFGASAEDGVSAGVRASHAYHVPTGANAAIGARLRAKIEK